MHFSAVEAKPVVKNTEDLLGTYLYFQKLVKEFPTSCNEFLT